MMRLLSDAGLTKLSRFEYGDDSLGSQSHSSQYHCEAGRIVVSPYHARFGRVLPSLHIASMGAGGPPCSSSSNKYYCIAAARPMMPHQNNNNKSSLPKLQHTP